LFATLHGGLPVPPTEPPAVIGRDRAALVAAAVTAQAAAGLDPVTDGDLALGDPFRAVPLLLAGIHEDDRGGLVVSRTPSWEAPMTVESWRQVSASTVIDGQPQPAAKVRLPGPFSLARMLPAGSLGVEALELGLAEALNQEVRALEAAGCPLVQIDEPELVRVGDDAGVRRRFLEAQRRLLDGTGIHAMLAVLGGSADGAGAATVFDAPFASVLVDLIAGPDNWRLVRQAPADRGIVCAALPVGAARTIDIELLVWAAHYAASANGRGLARVGLATAGSLAGLPWEEADRRMRLLGEAAGVAAAAPEEWAARLDPRALARPRRTLGPAVPTPPLDSLGRAPRALPDQGIVEDPDRGEPDG
jgi:hypothetical protein